MKNLRIRTKLVKCNLSVELRFPVLDADITSPTRYTGCYGSPRRKFNHQ